MVKEYYSRPSLSETLRANQFSQAFGRGERPVYHSDAQLAEMGRILMMLRTGRTGQFLSMKTSWFNRYPNDRPIKLAFYEKRGLLGGMVPQPPIEGATICLKGSELSDVDLSRLAFVNPSVSDEKTVRLLEAAGARVDGYIINGVRYDNVKSAAFPEVTATAPMQEAKPLKAVPQTTVSAVDNKEAKRAAAEAEAARLNAEKKSGHYNKIISPGRWGR